MSDLKKITVTGSGISGQTFRKQYLDLSGKSGLVFDNVTFEDSGQIFGKDASNITFHKCKFRRLDKSVEIFAFLTYGNDDWTFDDCDFSECPNAIYAKYPKDGSGNAAMRLRVLNGRFENIGVGEYADKDGHCIGRQGGHGHDGGNGDLIKGNWFRNSGTAIEYWGRADRMMSEIEIVDNDIAGCVKRKITEGCGIAISGSHNAEDAARHHLPEKDWLPRMGWRRNIAIARNKIANCEIGVSGNIREPIMGLNTNNILNCRQNLRIRNPFEGN